MLRTHTKRYATPNTHKRAPPPPHASATAARAPPGTVSLDYVHARAERSRSPERPLRATSRIPPCAGCDARNECARGHRQTPHMSRTRSRTRPHTKTPSRPHPRTSTARRATRGDIPGANRAPSGPSEKSERRLRVRGARAPETRSHSGPFPPVPTEDQGRAGWVRHLPRRPVQLSRPRFRCGAECVGPPEVPPYTQGGAFESGWQGRKSLFVEHRFRPVTFESILIAQIPRNTVCRFSIYTR